jgi:DHA1 family multidrug resistance protein-like MFS transporter
LLALRIIEGGLAGTVTASTALVAAAAPKERLGFSLGLVQTAVFSGSSLGPLIGGVLGDQIGYRPTFLVCSGMLFTAGLIVVFLVHERFEPQPRGPERGIAALRSGAAWMLAPLMITMISMLFVIRLASSAVQPIIPLYVAVIGHQAAENASTMAGFALGILGLTSAVSSVYLGRLGDQMGHRRILVACIFAAGLLYLPMAAAQTPWHLIALQGLFGVAAGGLIPAANALVGAATAPERRGALYGMTSAASSFGGFIGPLAGAGIAATLGFRVTFLAVAVLLLALGVVAVRVFNRQPVMEDAATRSLA